MEMEGGIVWAPGGALGFTRARGLEEALRFGLPSPV